MPFIFFPSPGTALAGRVLPPGLRRAGLWFLWLAVVLGFAASLVVSPQLIGVALILLASALSFTFLVLFFEYGIEEPILTESLKSAAARAKGKETLNIFPWCSATVVRAFPIVKRLTTAEMMRRLIAQGRAKPMFKRLDLSRNDALSALKDASDGDDKGRFSEALADAAAHAVHHGHTRIRFSDAFVAFSRVSIALRQFLFDHELDLDDLDAVAHWEDRRMHEEERRRKFWSRERLFAIRPFGRTWAYGYTPTLDRYATDLTERIEAQGSHLRMLERAQEIGILERALAKAASANALLIYEPGVGVVDVINGFAERVLNGVSLPFLNYRRVIVTDLGAAVAGLKTTGEIDGRVRRMLGEAARAGGTILVIENLHRLLGAEVGGIPIDLTATLTPFLKGSRIQVVATTTYGGRHEVLEKREGLMSYFERIEVREPDATETLQILLEVLPDFKKRFEIFVSYPVLKTIVTLAERTIQDVPFPRKAFDVLENALIAAAMEKERVLTSEYVARTVSERTEIPVGVLTGTEQKKLLELEDLIHERIVNQEQAVRVVSDALRRARAGIRGGSTTRPIGTFLFMGPTGVGKTETAKALAQVYFGSEKKMLRLDMSEFQGTDAVDRLIGSPATDEEGRLTTMVRENPFSLLLLDEFEKVYPKALDLFLQVFDEGRMKDGWGRKVTFTNTLIIATSNAGAQFIREYLKRTGEDEGLADALREEVLRRGIFRPELLNRFDGVVVFKPLGRAEVGEIAQRLLKAFAANLSEEKGVGIEVDAEAMVRIIDEGFNQEFGARELRRVLQDTVETVVAKKLLAGEVKRGDTVRITTEDLER